MTRSRSTFLTRITTLAVFTASCSSDALPTAPSDQVVRPQTDQLLGLLKSVDKLFEHQVSADIEHFSRYAIAF